MKHKGQTRKIALGQYRVYLRGVSFSTPMGDVFDNYQDAVDAIPGMVEERNALSAAWAYAPIDTTQLFVALA